MPRHHPEPSLLLDYAAGAAAEPVALILATHFALCPACRREVARIETLGGTMLDGLPADVADVDALAADALETAPPPAPPPAGEPCRDGEAIPRPLRDSVGAGWSKARWEQRAAWLRVAPLLTELRGYETRVVHLAAGHAIPMHRHLGFAYALVLAGAFRDRTGHYRRGDMLCAGPAVRHSPTADPGEDCICLAVAEAPPRFVGPLGPIRNRTLRV